MGSSSSAASTSRDANSVSNSTASLRPATASSRSQTPASAAPGSQDPRRPSAAMSSGRSTPGRGGGFQEVQLSVPQERSNGRGGGGGRGPPPDDRNRMQREKTVVSANEHPTYQDDDGVVLETFYHQNSSVYRCVVREGIRFYYDRDKKKWIVFPEDWLKRGFIITDKSNCTQDDIEEAEGRRSNRRQTSAAAAARGQGQEDDDRFGVIEIPRRGRLETYVAQERMANVHYFYDTDQGSWIRLPMAWELKSDFVKKLMDEIHEALPDWKDRMDMLAALRSCNYDTGLCIQTYLAWDDACKGDKSALAGGRTDADAKALADKQRQIDDLNNRCKSMEDKLNRVNKELNAERTARQQAEAGVDGLKDRISALEAEIASTGAQLDALKRPKTVVQVKQRPTVDSKLVRSLDITTQSLHKDVARVRMDVTNAFEVFNKMLKDVARGVHDISKCDSGVSEELNEMRELYRREALQRKLLYNQLQELRGNIRVFCRCRYDNRVQCCLQFPTDTDVLPPGSKKPFQFDKVFSPRSTQDEVYEDTKPLVTSCVDGYNVCILAYGQTGSGKTHTMQGTKSDPGVNVRALQDLLDICKARDNIEYQLKASMVEIYNETIHDLLSSKVGQLEIRAQGNKVVLPGMIEMPVESVRDIDDIIDLGQKNRTTAATKMNSQSSRSHLIFMISVRGRDKASNALSLGTLTLCDLAGSERVSKTEASGQRLVEAAAINKSLSSLGQVFTALRTGQLHVPYRNSKLTHILQPSLGGDAKACLFVMVSPDSNNLSETVSTLQFGSNAQQVQLGQAKKNVVKGPPGSD